MATTGENFAVEGSKGVERLCYVGVGVSDLAAWEDFATNVLGVAVSERGEDGTLFLRHDKHHYRVAVHPDPSDDLMYIGWQVADDDALDAMRAHLQSSGIPFEEGSNELAAARRVAEIITLTDPSGIRLEISHSPLIDYANPFVSPRPIGGFLTGDGGLGHMVISVDDFDESKRFYRKVLGMRVSDYIETQRGEHRLRIVFLHCNSRHHSLGFGSGVGRGKRMGHLMLQVNSLDDVGSTYDICLQRGITNTTIGRHPNDKMISFYLHTPSGWLYEYGYGAREVSDDEPVERFTVISEWGHLRADGVRYGGGKANPQTQEK